MSLKLSFISCIAFILLSIQFVDYGAGALNKPFGGNNENACRYKNYVLVSYNNVLFAPCRYIF